MSESKYISVLDLVKEYNEKRFRDNKPPINVFYFIGIRGKGKTYSLKRDAIKEFLEKGYKSVFLRDTKNQSRTFSSMFLADLNRFIEENKLKMRSTSKKVYLDEEEIILNIPITTTYDYKSTSFEEYYYIVYDEAVSIGIELPNKYNLLTSFVDTAFRDKQDKILIIVSNHISMNNVFFNKWNITSLEKGWNLFYDSIVIYNDTEMTSVWKEQKLKSSANILGKFGDYNKYAMEGDFLLDNTHNVGKFKGKKKFLYHIVLQDVFMSVWEVEGDKLYFSKYSKKTTGKIYAFKKQDADENRHINTQASNLVRMWYNAKFLYDKLYWENQEIKDIWLEYVRFLL